MQPLSLGSQERKLSSKNFTERVKMASLGMLIMENATTRVQFLMLLKVNMEESLEDIPALNLILQTNGIKMKMLSYFRFQTKRSLN